MAEWPINDPVALASVARCFEAYDPDLLANDLSALDDWFWTSPRTVRYGVGEELYGSDQIAAFRRARPPVRRAAISRRTITTFGTDVATTSIEFADAASLGRQTQTWMQFADGWKIINAHVSIRENT